LQNTPPTGVCRSRHDQPWDACLNAASRNRIEIRRSFGNQSSLRF
jgi:hypothetical protein